jgi:DNA helicase-2/ATP-dependent DNA helicase PcrA
VAETEPEHLQRLNPEQHRAVTTTEGPLLILAGAGSGKTRVLTRRIAHMLHTGVEPTEIIAVTFTNKAASEMKERVAELIGEVGKKVWVSTFHSSCCRILRQDIEALGYTRRFAIYDDDDQLRLLKGVVESLGYDGGRVEAREILSKIDHYKNRMLGVDAVLQERRSHINDPLIAVWRAYDESMRAADALDFNDLIGKTVELFKQHPDKLEAWRERFRFVMVDEYQDTNRGQYELLRLLADGHRNLAVVGDDDQSIYGFRGADVSNILSFEKDYPEATIVRLEQNYRSSGHILTLANAVVAQNDGRLDKKLWTQAPNGPKIQIIVAATPRDEAMKVAQAVLTLRRRGHDWSDIAIVYRTNAIARHFEHALRQVRVPYKVVGGKKFYERREVRDMLAYLRLVVNPVDDAAFLRVVNVPTRGIGAKTQAKLREEASNRGRPLLATARAKGIGRTAPEKGLHSFVLTIDALNEDARELTPDQVVVSVLQRSGYQAMLEADVDKNDKLTPDAKGRLDNLQELVRDAANFPCPPEAHTSMEWLRAWLDRIALTADADEVPEGGEVTLLTVHSSKGLEYPVVFVVQMNEGVFPHERSLDTGVEEERRLAYVAFTRAMKRLVVTRSLRHASRGQRQGGEAMPSRFLYGVPLEVLEGDIPDGDPASSAQDHRVMSDDNKRKLNAFLQRRMERAAIEDEHTLIDIESMEQLSPGVRVHHPRLGLGEIRHIQGTRLQIAFGGRQQWIPAGTPDLRIVQE